ncbi:hypothetical protein [Desulfovibrio sp. JC022]|uniref:hypothetical protein n=1 Tax=Desulfovibrio sp. JC022 TaxID=2593642 RepID=UPI0013D5B25D|nr:hypothetical protein [Desulfovibrio sp. JC022]NDV23231.1 hypothetical protein [Desulfovibrio sp. JC022]
MSLGRIAIFAAGATAGVLASYAVKSEKVRPVAVCTVKAGLKAKDWTVKQYETIREDVKSLAEQAREKGSSLVSKETKEAAKETA